MPKPAPDAYSEYDLYGSYGSSIGFSEEKRLSDKVKNKIKASFRYRDEIETADSDSLFSSKFSKFAVPKDSDSFVIGKQNKSNLSEIIKKQQIEGGKQFSFPAITKNIPSGGSQLSFPSIKK